MYIWMIKIIYDGFLAETRKSQASFQIIQVLSEAMPTWRSLNGRNRSMAVAFRINLPTALT